MKLAKTLLGAAAAVTLTAGAANAASIVNGSFENGTGDAGPGWFSTLYNGSTAIDGWTVTGDSVDWINGYWSAADGSHSVDLNGFGVGGVQQTIATKPGQTYRLTFSMSGNPDIGSDTRTLLVDTGGQPTLFTYSFTTPPNDHGNMGWQTDHMVFTALGSNTTISFQSGSYGNCCWGPALDNVSIAAVPEPTTWVMAILGMGMLGVALRRRPAPARAR
jgi:choice-of-anchor C domain-containing protein